MSAIPARFELTESQKIWIRVNKNKLANGWRIFSKNKLAMIGLLFILFNVFKALFASYIAPYEPHENHQDETGAYRNLEPPSWEHPMGTNHLAEDILTQWIYGSQVSLLVAIMSGLGVMIVGTSVGIFSGYKKGYVDLFLMRFVDVLYAIPAIPLILVIAMAYGSSVWNVILAMVLILWRTMARLIRSQTLSVSEREYVKAARAAGASNFRIITVHIAPALLPLILIEGVFVMGAAVLLEAGVSFLGLGATEMISWGVMLEMTFTTGAITHAWWWVLPPGISITFFVVSLFYISRGLEEITNPEVSR